MKKAFVLLLFVHTLQAGTASWYGPELQGELMANGKKFDWRKMTCASWGYPLGTKLGVSNKANGRSVVVTVTDRGPAKRLHREIDLSKAAFAKIADVKKGLVNVEVTRLYD